ncbi:MAG: GNAT family N-acetyltransferase [Gemmobacter sp.]|nr:GNAT family N-acetyltransferase [Gemmobacter sp.]
MRTPLTPRHTGMADAVEFSLQMGVPDAGQPEAVRLYWQAFRSKLGRVLGPDALAIDLLGGAVQANHAVVALNRSGDLVAMAGFRSAEGGFMPLAPRNLTRVYGRLGGLWRSALLRQLGDDLGDDQFVIEGVVVHPDWRGRGLGSAMIAELAAHARASGYDCVRLEVSDDNRRAKALYQRLGFQTVRHQRLRFLSPVFGMSGSTIMTRFV